MADYDEKKEKKGQKEDEPQKKAPPPPINLTAPPPATTPPSTSTAGALDLESWAYGFLKFIHASPTGPKDPRVQFLMSWVANGEGIFAPNSANNGLTDPYNPLAILITSAQAAGYKGKMGHYAGAPAVATVATKDEGYTLTALFMENIATGMWHAFRDTNASLAVLESALAATGWNNGQGNSPGSIAYAQRIGAAAGSTANLLGGVQAPGSSGGSSKAPPQAIVINQYGNTAVSNTKAATQYSAYEQTANALSEWGIDDPALIKMAHERAQAGEDFRQIIADIRETPQYAAAFPGMQERIKAGLPPLSEAQYISYQNAMMGLANKYSFPHGFITKTEVGKLVAQNVSPSEFQQRLDALSGVAIKADPQVRANFDRFFGVKAGLGALTAYFADPGRATDLLTQQANAAQLSAQAGESGLGALDKAHALHLAQLEYTQHLAPGTMRGAIDTASNWGYLRAGAPGSVAPRANENQLIGSQIAGYTPEGLAADRSAVKSAESARESFLQSGGGYQANPTGVAGVGSASTEGRGRA